MKGCFNLSLKIKELPQSERPYEKLELYGEKALSNAELLAIIIKSGTKEETSVQLANRILNLNYEPEGGELAFLKQITLEELKQIKGIGRVKAIQLKAVAELSIRMSKPSNYKKIKIKTSNDIANLLMEELKNEKKEIAIEVLMNIKNEILKITKVSEGDSNFVNISIKQLISDALKIRAPRMIVVHNHPSGDPTPSMQDIKFTDKLYNATQICGIDLLDHIIIGRDCFKSIFEETKKFINQ